MVALAVLREGAETQLFPYGIALPGETTAQVLTGGAPGLGAGALVGAALYKGLLRVPARWFLTVTAAMVLFIAAGMAGQMAQFLIQGDIIPALASPLRNTSMLLPDTSALGTLLHVLAGYDARPSAMQALFYIGALAIIAIGMRLARLQPARVGAAWTGL